MVKVRRILQIQEGDIAGDFTICSLAPSQGSNADALLNGAGNLRGFKPARPGVRDLRRLEVSIDSVVLEAFERPIACRLHLRRPSETGPDLRGEVFQVLDQLGARLHFVSYLLVGGLHGLAISGALLGST